MVRPPIWITEIQYSSPLLHADVAHMLEEGVLATVPLSATLGPPGPDMFPSADSDAKRSVVAAGLREPLIDAPRYTVDSVNQYLHLPPSTVRWWTTGNGCSSPAIRPADPRKCLLSFRNLVEAHVLSALRPRGRGRSRRRAPTRALVELLEERFQSAHPLADPRMGTEAGAFAQAFGAFAKLSPIERTAISDSLAHHLARISRDSRGEPCRLLVFTRGSPPDPGLIMVDPLVRSGHPCVVDTDTLTTSVFSRFLEGATISTIGEVFGLPREQVEEAIRFAAGGRCDDGEEDEACSPSTSCSHHVTAIRESDGCGSSATT
jgi:uncharacterized protein (DUF433 family)